MHIFVFWYLLVVAHEAEELYCYKAIRNSEDPAGRLCYPVSTMSKNSLYDWYIFGLQTKQVWWFLVWWGILPNPSLSQVKAVASYQDGAPLTCMPLGENFRTLGVTIFPWSDESTKVLFTLLMVHIQFLYNYSSSTFCPQLHHRVLTM